MRFRVNHRELGWIPMRGQLFKMVKMSDLRATIIQPSDDRAHMRIEATPHFSFVHGNPEPYIDYEQRAGMLAGFGLEHSHLNFMSLWKGWNSALYATFGHNSVIKVRQDKDYYVILDGVHRAALLARDGYTEIPVLVETEDGNQFDQYLADFENDFTEWYTPIQFDEDHIIHERTYPDWKPRPEFLYNKERGQAKWDYILRHHLPRDMSNRSVLDIGCNVGLFSLLMTEIGADVVGVDRGAGTVQPTNTNLGSESVVEQAYFVKNLFRMWNNRLYNIDYIERDLATEGIVDILDAYDVEMVVSLCVLYHFGRERMIELIEEFSRIPTVILQANHGHGGPLGLLASADTHVGILKKFGYSTEIAWGKDNDTTYRYPLIIGRK